MQDLINELLDLLDKETSDTNYLVESFVLVNKKQSGKLVLELLKEKYDLTNKKLSILNEQALPYTPDEVYLEILEKLLRHRNSSNELKSLVIQKIGWRGKYAKSLTSNLVDILESNNLLKGITSIALSELEWEKKEILVPYLIEVLRKEREYTIRMNAARQLLKYDRINSDVLPALIKALEMDQDFRVRQKIAHYIGELGRKEAIPNLENAIKNDNHTLVRSVASRVINELKELK